MRQVKLWDWAAPDFRLRQHGGEAASSTIAAPKMAALFWPNGRSCWPVNAYLVSLRGRSRATSTVNTYCSELSHLLRFLEEKRFAFESISDDRLIMFAEWMREQRQSCSPRHINRILLRTIEFLDWYQHRCPGERKLVGVDGEHALLTVERREGRVRNRAIDVVRHPALSPNNIARTVRPISQQDVIRLMDANKKVSKGSFTRSRNLGMLKLLMDSGIRREELVWVKVRDVLAAAQNEGRLRVRTSKRAGNPEREVPVPEATIVALASYVRIQRTLRIKRLNRGGTFLDEGWLFCTMQGTRMAAASVTQLFADLRQSAGISGRAHAHMLRHRWITLQLLHRLRQLESSGPLGAELLTTMLTRLSSITGHASIESLWTYVDWAYDEVGGNPHADFVDFQNFDRVLFDLDELLSNGASYDVLRKMLNSLRRMVSDGVTKVDLPKQGIGAHSLRTTKPTR